MDHQSNQPTTTRLIKHDVVTTIVIIFVAIAGLHAYELIATPRVFKPRFQAPAKQMLGITRAEEKILELDARISYLERELVGFRRRTVHVNEE